MDIKGKDTRVLWSLISEISKSMAERELIPASERTGLFKETSATLYEMFKAMVCECDDRMPD